MLTPSNWYTNQPASTGTTMYTITNTAGKYGIIKHIVLTNTASTTQTISVYRVTSGGSSADSNAILKNLSLGAYQSAYMDVTIVLGQNESIRATTSTSATITVAISGVTN